MGKRKVWRGEGQEGGGQRGGCEVEGVVNEEGVRGGARLRRVC